MGISRKLRVRNLPDGLSPLNLGSNSKVGDIVLECVEAILDTKTRMLKPQGVKRPTEIPR